MDIFKGFKLAVICTAFILSIASITHAEEANPADGSKDIISQNKGKVLVVLMGMEGCPGTEEATPFITEYSKSKPEGVAVCRIDVPPPGKKIGKASGISKDLSYVIDNDRTIADRLEFFFYPTTFVLDRDSVIRFSGDCRPDEIKKMVSEILAEKPGAEKKMYTPPLVKIGDSVPDFKISSAEGKEVLLKDVCGDNGAIIFFGAKSCPFSVAAVSDLAKLKQDFKDSRFNYAVMSFGEGPESFKDLYKEKLPGSIVMVDKDKSVSTGKFGVSAVPFFYVMDKDMKVVERKPFQYESARAAIAKSLGVESKEAKLPAKNPGAG